MRRSSTVRRSRRRTAIHEAGHSTISRVLTLLSGPATIRADYRGQSAGHAMTHDPWACIAAWQQRGKVSGDHEYEAAVRARIIAMMAGAESELLFYRNASDGDGAALPGHHGSDRYDIEILATEHLGLDDEQWARLEPRLRRMTQMLVRRHRATSQSRESTLGQGTLESSGARPPGWTLRRRCQRQCPIPALHAHAVQGSVVSLIHWLFVAEINAKPLVCFGLTLDEADAVSDATVEADSDRLYPDALAGIRNMMRDVQQRRGPGGRPLWDGIAPCVFRRATYAEVRRWGAIATSHGQTIEKSAPR
jgi:hypothetical protein